MAMKKKKKLTYSDMMGVMNQMAQTLTTVETLCNHYGKVLDDYITFQDNKDKFIAHLEDKYKPSEEETDATTKDQKGQSKDKKEEKEDDIKEILDDTDNKNAKSK